MTSYYNGEKFELVSNLYNVMCPYCSCIIIPKKIIFYKCNFIISGKKLDGEFVVPFALERIDGIDIISSNPSNGVSSETLITV